MASAPSENTKYATPITNASGKVIFRFSGGVGQHTLPSSPKTSKTSEKLVVKLLEWLAGVMDIISCGYLFTARNRGGPI